MNKVTILLLSPFRTCFPLFVFLWLLFCGATVFGCVTINYQYKLAILMAFNGLVYSYVAVLLYSILPKIIKDIFLIAVIIISMVLFAMELYCVLDMKQLFDADLATVILTTNFSEAKEFAATLLPVKSVITITLTLLCVISSYFILKHFQVLLGKIPALLLLIIVFCSAYTFRYDNVRRRDAIGKIAAFVKYDVPPDLKDYYVPGMFQTNNNAERPQNIVLIVGESYSKFHSSLYGYEKETNPYLSKLSEEGCLIQFDSVSSPATTTMKSFVYMFTTLPDKEKEVNWSKNHTLFEGLASSPYKTFWYSNQASIGAANNITRVLSELCDESFFCDKIATDLRSTVDEEVLTLFKKTYQSNSKYNFILFHLMGSHFKCDLRYPASFGKFKEEDYLEYPENQRATLASYDNSILYNDFVVYSIIREFTERDLEAVIIYLPDHGMDIYYTDPNYAAHGRNGDPQSVYLAEQIPFLIAVTPKYQEHFTSVLQRMEMKTQEPFNSSNLIYTILDLASVNISGSDDVAQFSLFGDM